jgi:DNA-binding transcriptional MerR regulator
MASMKKGEPQFSRSDVARILNITPLTIANREKRAQYPVPKRDLNEYRIYTLNDVFNLQVITYQTLDTRPIMSLLYDKGYRDLKRNAQIIDAALSRRKGLV